jgi:hypothetical protein
VSAASDKASRIMGQLVGVVACEICGVMMHAA